VHSIPTLYLREFNTEARITPVVRDGCWWVVNGQGKATRLYDGVCVAWLPTIHAKPAYGREIPLLNVGALGVSVDWFQRVKIPASVKLPDDFTVIDQNRITGTWLGWQPVDLEKDPLADALRVASGSLGDPATVPFGTYELCGPGIKDNADGFERPTLIRHADAEQLDDVPNEFHALMEWLVEHEQHQGVVWRHPDGRMAKIRRTDAVSFREGS
jgi:hypothetical protein